MISEKQIVNKVQEEGQAQESIGMSLDMESAQVLMQMLSKNLYSDPQGSTVRECTSNGLDSHRRAGVTDAIIVSLKVNAQNNYEFSVEDFGTGLDANDVQNIISKYGKSTKRESNTEIGMMGLGFKSPLAYCSSFHFVCRKDGMERKYMMYEGEDVNTIDLLYEAPTTERNGVKVIVPVKFADRYIFKQKIEEQLAYFDSVYFDVNVQNDVVPNDFLIYRADNFQVSEMYMGGHMHICLDNVYYPIDFPKLGILPISIPVGLRFGLTDGIFPTPNREQLIYTTITKKKIIDKITQVSDDLINKFNENSIVCNNVKEIFAYYASSARNVPIGKKVINIESLSSHSTIKFNKPELAKYPLSNFKTLYNLRESLFLDYRVLSEFKRGKFNHTNSGTYPLNYTQATNNHRVMLQSEPLVGNKKSYIKSLLPPYDYNPILFVKKTKKMPLFSKSNTSNTSYFGLLDLHKHPKDTWRARIVECQQIAAELASKLEDVDKITIPQHWLDARKKKRVASIAGSTKRVKLQGEINCKITDELQRFVQGKHSKLTPTIIKVEDIASASFLHVYGKQCDESKFDNLYSIAPKQKIKFYVLSEREHRVAENLDIHNFMPIEKFMEGKNKPFKRLVTSYLIYKLTRKYHDTFQKREILSKISTTLKNDLDALSDYAYKHHDSNCSEDIYASMLAIAEEHNLYDETIYTEYKKIKQLLDNFTFIETYMDMVHSTAGNGSEANERYITTLADLFKYHRIRIDYTNYKLVLNPEPEVTDETIEELTQNA